MCEQHGRVVLPRERRLPCQTLVGEAGKRVEVAPRVEGPALDLLRRAVADGSHQFARLRERAILVELPGDAEVGEIGIALAVEQDVGRLHVPVQESAAMGDVEGRRETRQEPESPLRLERTLAREQRAEVFALDIAHREVQLAVALSRGVDRDDVRVL